MKILDNVVEIESSLQNPSKQFTIKSSAKAFKILSDNLYSNKIKAIIRELSCNAYDAHIAGNNKEPFIIHIPDYLDSSFYIKDFGIGLSHEDVMNLYTTYFDSSKNNSNDYIGALGLGSKSPFSYTNDFMVESIFNKQKNIYLMYIDESGCPAVNLVSSEYIDEPNGVMVKFDVKPDDVYEFKFETKQVLSLFPRSSFNIIGGMSNDNLYEPINFNNKDYYRSSTYINNNKDNICALMGNILYPIDINNIFSNILDTVKIEILNLYKFIVKFDIGELDIAPSRESLSYVQHTKDAIVRKIDYIISDIVHEHVNSIYQKTEIVDIIREFNSINSLYLRKSVYNIIINKLSSLDIDELCNSNYKLNLDTVFILDKLNKEFSDLNGEIDVNLSLPEYVGINRRVILRSDNSMNKNIASFKTVFIAQKTKDINVYRNSIACVDDNIKSCLLYINSNQKGRKKSIIDYVTTLLLKYGCNVINVKDVNTIKNDNINENINRIDYTDLMIEIVHRRNFSKKGGVDTNNIINNGKTYYLEVDNKLYSNHIENEVLVRLFKILCYNYNYITIYKARKDGVDIMKSKNIPNILVFIKKVLNKHYRYYINECIYRLKNSNSFYNDLLKYIKNNKDIQYLINDKSLVSLSNNYNTINNKDREIGNIYNSCQYKDYMNKTFIKKHYDTSNRDYKNLNIYKDYIRMLNNEIHWGVDKNKVIINILNWIYNDERNKK